MNQESAETAAKETKITSVIDEINRGKEYLRSLEQRHSVVVKPKLETDSVEELYPDFFVERVVIPDYAPDYDDCRHIRQTVINRDTLNLKQHINLLAQPRLVRQRKVEEPYILKRKVHGPSPRIVELAQPKARRALETCKRYGTTMQKFTIENCHRNIQDMTFVPVRDAVYFIKLNRRKPLIERQKLQQRMKRLQERINEAKTAEMQQMLRKLFLPLKDHFMTSLPEYIAKVEQAAQKAAEEEAKKAAQKTMKANRPKSNSATSRANAKQLTTVENENTTDTSVQPTTDDPNTVTNTNPSTADANDPNASAVQPLDKQTLQLSEVIKKYLLKCKYGKLPTTIETGTYSDRFLVHISGQLAVWMNSLLNKINVAATPPGTPTATPPGTPTATASGTPPATSVIP